MTLDPQVVLQNIFKLDLSKCDISVCLASFEKDQTEPHFEKLQTLGHLNDTFRGIVNFTLEHRRLDSDLHLSEYVFDTKIDAYEIEYLHLKVAPYDIVDKQIVELKKPLAGMSLYKENQTFLKGVRFYAIVVTPPMDMGEEPICFFRSYTQKNKLRRGMFAAIWSNQGYDQVKPEKVFLFDEEIDCFSRGEIMFIFDKEKFHQMFHFFEELAKTADESLQKIRHLPIAHFEEFEEACRRSPLKIAKLRSIAGKPYLAMLTIERLKRFIKKRHLQVKIEVDAATGQEMLVYEAKSHWQLLKLLDDDYLLSELTEHSYEVNGKREV